ALEARELALKDVEAACDSREQALADAEKAAESRERALGDAETAFASRRRAGYGPSSGGALSLVGELEGREAAGQSREGAARGEEERVLERASRLHMLEAREAAMLEGAQAANDERSAELEQREHDLRTRERALRMRLEVLEQRERSAAKERR